MLSNQFYEPMVRSFLFFYRLPILLILSSWKNIRPVPDKLDPAKVNYPYHDGTPYPCSVLFFTILIVASCVSRNVGDATESSDYSVGHKVYHVCDSTRTFTIPDRLNLPNNFGPMQVSVWYPVAEKSGPKVQFKSTDPTVFFETQRIERYLSVISNPYIKKDTLFFKKAKNSFANGNLKKALRYINRAIRKKNMWTYRSYKAEILRMLGKDVDAVALYEQEVLRAEQPIKYYQWIIMTQVLAGHLDDAIQRIDILESKYPEQQGLKAQKGWIYAKQAYYDKAIKLYGDNDAALGWVYALKGDKKNALKYLENLLGQLKKEWWNKWDIALIYAVIPEKDNALRLLEDIVATLEKENPEELVKLGWRMAIESDYDQLRADKKFQELMARTKYPLNVFLKKNDQ